MRKNKRSLTPLLIGILSFLLLLFFTHSFSPSAFLFTKPLRISSVIPFFLLFFLTLFGLAGFILKSRMQGILAGSFGIFFLLLRMFSFTHWFFTVVLIALFGVIELVIIQKS